MSAEWVQTIATDPGLCAAREHRSDLAARIADRVAEAQRIDGALDEASGECGQLLAAKIAGDDVSAALLNNRGRRSWLHCEREDLQEEITLLRREDAAAQVVERQAERAARRRAAAQLRTQMDAVSRANHVLLVEALRKIAAQAGLLAAAIGLESQEGDPQLGAARIVDRAVGDELARAMAAAGLDVDPRVIETRPWPSPFRQQQAAEPKLTDADEDDRTSEQILADLMAAEEA